MEINNLIEKIKIHESDELIINICERILKKINLNRKGNYFSHQDILVAGVLFLAYKKANRPIQAKEIAEKFNLKTKNINHCFKTLKRALNIKYCNNQSILSTDCLSKPKVSYYINKVGKELNLNNKVINDAINLANEYEKFSDAKPSIISVAASSIYLSGKINKIKITQRSIVKFISTETTISSVSRYMMKKLGYIKVPNECNKFPLEKG